MLTQVAHAAPHSHQLDIALQRADEFALRLFRRLPQSRRFVPEDPKELVVYESRSSSSSS